MQLFVVFNLSSFILSDYQRVVVKDVAPNGKKPSRKILCFVSLINAEVVLSKRLFHSFPMYIDSCRNFNNDCFTIVARLFHLDAMIISPR